MPLLKQTKNIVEEIQTCFYVFFIIGWCDRRKHYSTENNITNSNRSVSERCVCNVELFIYVFYTYYTNQIVFHSSGTVNMCAFTFLILFYKSKTLQMCSPDTVCLDYMLYHYYLSASVYL